MAMWMVRAGPRGAFYDSFKKQGLVAVGWSKVGDARAFPDREALRGRLLAVYGYDLSVVRRGTSALWRFVHEIEENDTVLIYDPR